MHTHTHHSHGGHGAALAIGIALNSLFVLAEIFYGLQAQSLALLADAGHNASDVLGLMLAWGAVMISRRPASERFTYGLQSASIFAALINGLLLIAAVGGIGWEALQRLAEPREPETVTVMLVASAGVLVNGATAWLLHRSGHGDLNMRGAFLHMATDAAISLGVVVSALLMALSGWLWLDPLVSIGIVMIIAAATWTLFKEALSLALHAVPAHINHAEVKAFLASLPGVAQVHDLHIWAMSTSDVALSAHLLMPGGHPGDGFLHEAGHALEERFNITHATIQIEIGDVKDACHLYC